MKVVDAFTIALRELGKDDAEIKARIKAAEFSMPGVSMDKVPKGKERAEINAIKQMFHALEDPAVAEAVKVLLASEARKFANNN